MYSFGQLKLFLTSFVLELRSFAVIDSKFHLCFHLKNVFHCCQIEHGAALIIGNFEQYLAIQPTTEFLHLIFAPSRLVATSTDSSYWCNHVSSNAVSVSNHPSKSCRNLQHHFLWQNMFTAVNAANFLFNFILTLLSRFSFFRAAFDKNIHYINIRVILVVTTVKVYVFPIILLI